MTSPVAQAPYLATSYQNYNPPVPAGNTQPAEIFYPQDAFQASMDSRLARIDNNLAGLATPDSLFSAYQPSPGFSPAYSATVGPTLTYPAPMAYDTPVAPVNSAAPAFSPYVPTLTTLDISRADLQWALQLEDKVKTQNYAPNAEETARYQSLASQLEAMQNNIRPLTPAPALPLMQNYQPMAPSAPSTAPTTAGPVPPSSGKQVTMSEIEWSLVLEDKVQKWGYQPTPAEETKYQDILGRFKVNPKIKVGILDALAAQSPWIGANVSSIRYTKSISGNVSAVISAFKGGGSVATAVKSLGMNMLKSTGLSALVSGGFSAVTNTIAVMRGEKTKTQAVANVVSDTVGGAVTGLGATMAGGLVMTALAATSIAGWPLTLLVGGAGVLGGYLADKFFTKTGAKTWIKSKIIEWMDKPKAQTVAPAQPMMAPAR